MNVAKSIAKSIAERIATRIAMNVAMNGAILARLRVARGGSSGSLVPQMARNQER
jgi:ribosomal protein S3